MKLKWLGLFGNLILFAGGMLVTVAFLRIVDHLHTMVKASELTIASIRDAEELENIILQHNRVSFLWASTHAESYAKSINRYEQEINQWLNVAETHADDDPKGLKVFSEAKVAILSYISEWHQLEASNLSPSQIFEKVTLNLQEACHSVQRISEIIELQERTLQVQANEQNLNSHYVAFSSGILLILAIYGFLATIRRTVLKPLTNLQSCTQKFGQGDWESRVAPSGLKELKSMGVVFNEMADGLSRIRNQQVRILASIAHDLRNPLAGIKMSAELLLLESESSQESRFEMINIISRQATRLDRIVSDFLDVARIEAGQMELRIGSHDLCELVLDTAKIFQSTSLTHTITTDIPTAALNYSCDADRISQVLNNLVSNAIKYSPFGGQVNIDLKAENGFAMIGVSDEGIGISPEDIPRIFDPFWRSNTTKDTIPGVGLGLASTKRIIETHGGRIEVESLSSKGSLFRIFLPFTSQPTGI